MYVNKKASTSNLCRCFRLYNILLAILLILSIFLLKGCSISSSDSKQEFVRVVFQFDFEAVEQNLDTLQGKGMFTNLETIYDFSTLDEVQGFNVSNIFLLSSFDVKYYSINMNSPLGHPQYFFLQSTFGTHIPEIRDEYLYLLEGKIFNPLELGIEELKIPIMIFNCLAKSNDLEINDLLTLDFFVRYPNPESIEKGYITIETGNSEFYHDRYIFEKLSFEFIIVGILEARDILPESMIGGKNTFFIPHWGFDFINTTINKSIQESWIDSVGEIPNEIIRSIIISNEITSFELMLKDKDSLEKILDIFYTDPSSVNYQYILFED